MNTIKTTGKIRLLVLVSTLLLAAVIVGGLVYATACPCERTPGLWVSGEIIEEPVTDWSFANNAGLCQIQVSGVLPHAVTLNCMADEQRLFVSCSRCDGKTWSGYALDSPEGWIKVEESRYPVMVNRVTDQAQLDKAWAARARKVSRGSDQARPEHWWSFELTSRSP